MLQMYSVRDRVQFLVIISRTTLFSTLIFVLFSVQMVLAQEPFVEINLNLYVNGSEAALLENQVGAKKTKLLDLSTGLFLDNLKVRLVQISEDKIKVEFHKSLQIGYYSAEETRNLKVDSFVIVDEPKNIDLMMSLSPGTLHTDKYAKMGFMRNFIQSLAPFGITQTMARYINTQPPMKVFKVLSFSAFLNVTDLLKERDVKLESVIYFSVPIVGAKFYDVISKYVPIQLNLIRPLLPNSELLVKRYIEVYKQYKVRYARLSQLGWLSGLGISRQSNFIQNENTSSSNIVPLFSNGMCKTLFND